MVVPEPFAYKVSLSFAGERAAEQAIGFAGAVDVGCEHRVEALVGAQQRDQALLAERLAEVHEAPTAPGSERRDTRFAHAVRGGIELAIQAQV